MPSKMSNEYGTITVENEVIARIAGAAALDCAGVAGMAALNVREGFVQLLRRESFTKGIQLFFHEETIAIDLHIIVEYGSNINAVADALMIAVKNRVEAQLGQTVEKVNVFVEGVRMDH